MESLPVLRVFAVLDRKPQNSPAPQIIAFEIWDGANFLAACGTSKAIGPTIHSILAHYITLALTKYPIGRVFDVPNGAARLTLDKNAVAGQAEASDANVEVLTFTADCDPVGTGGQSFRVSTYSVLDVLDEDLATFERNVDRQLLKTALASIDIDRRLGWVERVRDRKRDQEARESAALTF